MPYWDEPRHNDPESINEPGDVSLPSTLHFMQARAEVNLLVQAGALSDEEGESVLSAWRARNELDGSDRVGAAIDLLEEHGVIDDGEAEGLREKASA